MTVYELIGKLSEYPPDTKVVIVPERREKYYEKDEQVVGYVTNRGMSKKYGAPVVEEPVIRLNGVKNP